MKTRIRLSEEQLNQAVRQAKPRAIRGMSGAGVHGGVKYNRNRQKRLARKEIFG